MSVSKMEVLCPGLLDIVAGFALNKQWGPLWWPS